MADEPTITPHPSQDLSQYIRTYAKDVAMLTGKAAPVAAKTSLFQKNDVDESDGVVMPEFDASPVQRSGQVSPKEYESEVLEVSKDDANGIFEGQAAPAAAPTPMRGNSSIPQSPISIVPDVAKAGELPADRRQRERKAIFDRLRGYTVENPAPTETPEPKAAVTAETAAAPSAQEPAAQVPAPAAPEFEPVPVPAFMQAFPASVPMPVVHKPEPAPAAFVPKPAAVAPAPAPVSVPPSAPAPVVPAFETPAPIPAPPMPQVSRPLPPPVAAPAPRVFPTPTPAPAPFSAAPDNLHTYKSDFADRIDTKSASTFSVLAAQGDAAPQARAVALPTKKKSALLPIAGGIVLILVGIGAAYGAYFYISRMPAVQALTPVPSLIVPDETKEVFGTGADLMQAVANVAAQPSIDSNIIVTYVTDATTTASKGIARAPQPGGVLIDALPLNAPDILLRNIDPQSTIGIADGGAETRPFFIFKVTSYERTFAGMLAWEQTIGSDLALFYPAYADASAVATTTATGAKAPPAAQAPHFIDSVVANHDVRILQDSAGRSVLIYGYRDKDTLIIARDAATFSLLLDRLASGGSK